MSGWWGVFVLFTVPIGGGIPAGVLLAQKRGIGVPAMEFLYFCSDLVLAAVFEPMMRGLIAGARRHPALSRVKDVLKETVRRTTSSFGSVGGPLSLVLISFGVDPMTGRAATHAAGHGIVTGWALTIAGDMMYFTLIMVSTLWLNSVLGDGLKTMLVVMAAMFLLPELIRRWRERSRPAA